MRDVPSVEDGLRDIERRLLVALRSVTPARFAKSTRVLQRAIGDMPSFGEVISGMRPLEELLTNQRPWRATRDPLLGAYAALVDMAQPFRSRAPLVDARGNFGTQHGDPPADHMYTECRLAPWGAMVLDGLAPNLLVNGARAERPMAFHLLPHNLGEVVSALLDCANELEEPRSLVPDFPCGGVVDEASLEAIARTGRGTLRVRARMHVEHADGAPLVVVTESPQDVELNDLVELSSRAIGAGLVRSVRDLRDESVRDGLRIVFVGVRGANPDEIAASVYAHTPCAASIHVDGLALVDGEERCLTPIELVRETWRRLRARLADPVAALRALVAEHDTPRRTSIARFAEVDHG